MTQVKVRFAPSPTGFMHIGGTRTALFNWLWAKKINGKFMLRIDDTDVQRSKKEYEDAILRDLKWLGLEWDEMAHQSQREARYQEVAQKLIAQGRIYPCYETPEELEFMRKKLMAKGLPPIYDRSALKLTEEQKANYLAQGRKPHYRFKLEEGTISWTDMIRGECKYEASKLADPVVIREDGTFLYHLPSVIDDADFQITHILRGEDHVTNTAMQIQMFEALGALVPQFAHLPLLTGKEGKLSKRMGSLGVDELRQEGVEALAICSYLAKLGTSDGIEPFYKLEDLANSLDFTKIGRSQPKFDVEELKHFNTKFIHSMPYNPLLGITENFWNVVRQNISTVSELDVWKEICFENVNAALEDKELCSLGADVLPPEPWNEETYKIWIDKLKQSSGKSGKDLFHPIRIALTGKPTGPELKILLPLIGYQKAYDRLKGN